MRRDLVSALVLVAAAAALAACGPTLPETAGPSKAAEEAVRWAAEAQAAIQAGRWDEASRLFRKQAEAAAAEPGLAPLREQALYNVACAEARAGRKDEAAKAFAECIAGGFGQGLTLPHVLEDADIDSLRDEPAYHEALRPFLASDERRIDAVGDAPGDARRPALVVLTHLNVSGPPLEEGAPPQFAPEPGRWADPEVGGARIVAAISGPIQLGRPDAVAVAHGEVGGVPRAVLVPPRRHWLLPDGDDRWAVAKVRAALDSLAADPRVDADRIAIVATEPEAATAAWAAALAMPGRIAGVVAPGARFRRIAWADAVAAVARERAGKTPWTVMLGAADDVAATALAAAGADVVRVTPEGIVASVLDRFAPADEPPRDR